MVPAAEIVHHPPPVPSAGLGTARGAMLVGPRPEVLQNIALGLARGTVGPRNGAILRIADG
jgi:hypothetical protein